MENRNIYQKPAALALLALVTCALWGAAFPAVKIGFELFGVKSTGSKILFAGYRFFLAGVLTFVVVSLKERKILKVKKSSIPALVMQGVVQTTIQYVCFYIGLSNTTGTKGSIINGSNGFFSILLAHFLLKDKLTARKLVGCIIGFAGVILVNIGGVGKSINEAFSGFSFGGEGLIIICAIAFGLSSVTLKMIADKETPNTITAYQLIIGGAILIVMGKLLGGDLNALTVKSGFCMLILVLISTVAFTLWANLLKNNPVGKVTIYSFTIPVFGVILSILFLHEDSISIPIITALVLVSIGIIIVNREGKNK